MPAVVDLRERLQRGLADRYQLDRELGRGGMATVYLAHDPQLHRQVALKVLQSELGMGAGRFLREIELAAGLTHPHILPLHHSGEVAGLLYYVMPYVEGESLRERLQREARLPVAEVVRLGQEVADALAYAHGRGVIHRDIKPENILLASGHALVADFGIARALDAAGGATLTEVGATVGTPMYMSPEQAAGEPALDGRTDVYSLGCVLYEALAGRPPFTGPTVQAVLVSRLLDTPPRLRAVQSEVPEGLEEVIARALAREPAERYASAAEFSAALGSWESVRPGQRERPSVAVLPFVNLSPDPDNEYFSDGMTDELINALGRIPGLRVAARTSAFAFKGKDTDVRAIGERLGVRTVLEGSVRKAGSRLRIIAQLVDAGSGYHLWSETYERELADVFALQDEMARTIAGALEPRLSGPANLAGPAPPTPSLEAYTLCLRGQYHLNRRTTEDLKLGIEYFDRVLAIDPQYALAWAELGACHAFRGFDEFADLPPRETMPRAKAAIERAIALDPSLAEAHSRRGAIALLYDWDWELAERSLLRAIALKPGASFPHMWYALMMAGRGRHEESLRSAARALAVDPLSQSVILLSGRSHYWARQYDEAMAQLEVALDMDPGYQLTYAWMARVRVKQGNLAEALALAERGARLHPPTPNLLSIMGVVQARMGRRTEALATLEQLRLESRRRWVSPFFQSYILGALGDSEGAIDMLEAAVEERSGFVPLLLADPTVESLSAHPRVRALVRKIGLPDQ